MPQIVHHTTHITGANITIKGNGRWINLQSVQRNGYANSTIIATHGTKWNGC